MNERRRMRFAVMLTDGEVQRIQNFRFANRIGTTAEAVRMLVEKGLEASASKAATGVQFGDQAPAAALNTTAVAGGDIVTNG
ncbi:hypothetical protein ACFQU1_20655 [Chelatococcus sp. GCM10030263]|uniref:hypothetical protein n=1 Tax=Chelatococcus sp. GCM10030263 TaxID=3273387 RepID=UPI00361DDDE9